MALVKKSYGYQSTLGSCYRLSSWPNDEYPALVIALSCWTNNEYYRFPLLFAGAGNTGGGYVLEKYQIANTKTTVFRPKLGKFTLTIAVFSRYSRF